VIGVFDHPPADDTNISYIRLSNLPGTSVYLGNKGAYYLTQVERYLRHLIT